MCWYYFVDMGILVMLDCIYIEVGVGEVCEINFCCDMGMYVFGMVCWLEEVKLMGVILKICLVVLVKFFFDDYEMLILFDFIFVVGVF